MKHSSRLMVFALSLPSGSTLVGAGFPQLLDFLFLLPPYFSSLCTQGVMWNPR